MAAPSFVAGGGGVAGTSLVATEICSRGRKNSGDGTPESASIAPIGWSAVARISRRVGSFLPRCVWQKKGVGGRKCAGTPLKFATGRTHGMRSSGPNFAWYAKPARQRQAKSARVLERGGGFPQECSCATRVRTPLGGVRKVAGITGRQEYESFTGSGDGFEIQMVAKHRFPTLLHDCIEATCDDRVRLPSSSAWPHSRCVSCLTLSSNTPLPT